MWKQPQGVLLRMNCCRLAIIQQLQILTLALRFLVSFLIFDGDHGLLAIALLAALTCSRSLGVIKIHRI